MRAHFRPTIRLRLTLLYGAAFLIAGFILLGTNYAMVRQNLDGRQPGAASGSFFLSGIDDVQPPPSPPGPSTNISGEAQAGQAGPRTLILDPNGMPLTPSDIETRRNAEGLTIPEVVRRAEEKVRDDALHELVVQSSVALGVMTLVSIGLGWLLAGRALRPLQEVTTTAKRLSSTNLHERIDMNGPNDELKELADTFDAMLGRLDTSFENQRRFVANTSHELRTPLAVQRALVDVTLADRDAGVDELRDAISAIGDGVERSERGIANPLPVDLAAIATDVVHQLKERADGIALSLQASPMQVAGDPVLLERLVVNLVENAIKYNVLDGFVAISVSDGAITVSNSGPHVPRDAADTLFEPFRRLQADRTGSVNGAGLGLSIVKAIALSHGGSVSIKARDEGGLVVKVAIPEAR